MRKRGGRKRAPGTRAPMSIPQDQNLRWSLDFVMDTLSSGRRFRVLTLVDDFTRECLGLVVDTTLTALRVVRELGQIIESRGCPPHDRQRQRHRVHFKCDIGLAGRTRDRVALYRARQADAERVCRKLQRVPARRVSERAPVRQSQRGPPDHRGMEDRLQHQPTAHEPQRAYTDRICNPPQEGPNPERILLINGANWGAGHALLRDADEILDLWRSEWWSLTSSPPTPKLKTISRFPARCRSLPVS